MNLPGFSLPLSPPFLQCLFSLCHSLNCKIRLLMFSFPGTDQLHISGKPLSLLLLSGTRVTTVTSVCQILLLVSTGEAAHSHNSQGPQFLQGSGMSCPRVCVSDPSQTAPLVKCGTGAATSKVLNSCRFPKQGWGRQLREAPAALSVGHRAEGGHWRP